jgi:hypothetical protein
MMLDGDLGFSKSGLLPKARKSAIRVLILRALLHVSREKGRNRLQDAF